MPVGKTKTLSGDMTPSENKTVTEVTAPDAGNAAGAVVSDAPKKRGRGRPRT